METWPGRVFWPGGAVWLSEVARGWAEWVAQFEQAVWPAEWPGLGWELAERVAPFGAMACSGW